MYTSNSNKIIDQQHQAQQQPGISASTIRPNRRRNLFGANAPGNAGGSSSANTNMPATNLQGNEYQRSSNMNGLNSAGGNSGGNANLASRELTDDQIQEIREAVSFII